ncbi:MAG TPA: response regulator, partial [Steroidobacteraceae bacterium]
SLMADFCARSAGAARDSAWALPYPARARVSLVRIMAAASFAVAVLILLGWALDLTILKSGMPGERATQPLSAVCFALCSISLGLSTERCILCRLVTRGCAMLVLGVAIVTVWQNALDVDWGLDQFLFSDAVAHEQPGPYLRPGRPAAGTLVALGLLCSSLLLIRARTPAARSLFVWLSTIGSFLSATILLAYLYNLHALYALGFYATVGLNSGIALSLLFYGVLLRRADLGWMRLLAAASAGAVSARRILVWTASLFVVLAVVVRLGRSALLDGGGFEVLLLAVGGFGVLLAALLSHTRRLDALETMRHNVASDLRAAQSQLVRAAQDKEKQLALLAHELRNPLTPLRNGIEIVRQLSSANPALGRTTDMMSRQIEQLVRLVDELVGGDAPAELSQVPASGASRLLKILIADDNADAAESLALLLQSRGHVVRTARDGRSAVESAAEFRPDVVVMDLAMPELDGVAATRAIRATSWGAHVRIIALTAWGQESHRRLTQEAGMDVHLVKPVEPHVLLSVLSTMELPRQS